jgi:hypothetical protein
MVSVFSLMAIPVSPTISIRLDRTVQAVVGPHRNLLHLGEADQGFLKTVAQKLAQHGLRAVMPAFEMATNER